MKQRNYRIVALIMGFWFVISFITNIIDNFRLTHLALVGFIPMSFFLAYGIMSIPAGLLIERFSQKAVLTVGFLLPLVVGWLGDLVGLRIALLFVCLTIAYIVSIVFWARPLVENKCVRFSELFKPAKR